MNNKLYDILKPAVQIVLPAIATLFFTLSKIGILGIPYTETFIGCVAALTFVLGIFLLISSKRYDRSDAKYDGGLVVETTKTGSMLYSLELDGDPEELVTKDSVSFKIRPEVIFQTAAE